MREKKLFEKVLEDYREMVWGCSRCNWCQNHWGWSLKSARFNEICPAFYLNRFFPYSGMGKMHIARALIEGDFDCEDSDKLLEIVYQCTTCGACEMNCLRLQEKTPLKVTEALRSWLVEKGIGPLPEHKQLTSSIRTYGNPWLQPRERRDRWARGVDIRDVSKEKEKVDLLYFVGCTAAFDPLIQKMAKDTVNILRKGGVNLGFLGTKEVCCGSPAIRVGDRELFFKLAKENIETFNKLGIHTIVTTCPGCYRVLKYDYTEVPGVPEPKYEVIHTTQYVEKLLKEGNLVFEKDMPVTVTWHDPCHLGRHCGIYDAPRNILKSIPGLKIVEMERNKDQAFCCGAGGGARTAFIDFAVETASERIEEAKASGAEALVTSCPFCEQNFTDALHAREEKIKLYDLNDLVMQSL